MPHADFLLTHANVITMNSEFEIIPDGAVAVHGQMIVAIGTTAELKAEYDAAEVLDCGGKALIPGLVNADTHASMTLLRGLEDDSRLDVWLLGYMMPVEREFVSPEFCKVGAKLACAEMIRSGITSFADMYYYEEAVAEAVAEVGMRAVCGQTVLKFPSPDAESFEDSLEAARGFIERWKDHDLIIPAVSPHAPYTCTAEIMHACAELAKEYDVPSTRTSPRPLRRLSSGERPMTCRWYRGSRSRARWRPRSSPPTASTSTRARCIRWSMPTPAWPTIRPATSNWRRGSPR